MCVWESRLPGWSCFCTCPVSYSVSASCHQKTELCHLWREFWVQLTLPNHTGPELSSENENEALWEHCCDQCSVWWSDPVVCIWIYTLQRAYLAIFASVRFSTTFASFYSVRTDMRKDSKLIRKTVLLVSECDRNERLFFFIFYFCVYASVHSAYN